MFRLFMPLIVLLLLVSGVLAWSNSGASEKADFRFVNRGDIITLDLNQMSYLQDFRITFGIRSGLYTFDPETITPIPDEAESYSLSDDKRVWTFTLRENLRWSNGDPVTTADYVFSWRRMLEEPGEYTSLFYYIKNAEAYEKSYLANGDASKAPHVDFKDVGIKALDARTLEVTLTNPVPFLLDLMAFPPFYPRHEKSMEPFKKELSAAQPGKPESARYTYDNKYTRPPHVVTNGPFMITTWEFKRRLRMEQNPYYWDRASVVSKSIEMVNNDNPVNQLLQYEAGGVDWLADVQSDIAYPLKLSGRDKKDLRIGPAFGTAFLSVNCGPDAKITGFPDKNPLSDQRVRQALAMAIDREEIVTVATRMGERPTTGYVPPGILQGYNAQEGFGLNVERAKQLLAEAGYPNGEGLPPIPLLFNSENGTRKAFCELIKNQWERHIGVRSELRALEVKSYRSELQNKTYAIAAVAWYGDYMDPSTFTDKYRSSSVNNDSNWGPPEYDALLDRAAAEPDAEKRMRMLEEAERMINTQLPIIPLYNYVNVTLYRDNVVGLYNNPKLLTMLKYVGVKK